MKSLSEKVLKAKFQPSPSKKIKTTVKWVLGIKLSLAMAATGYLLSTYKPYDVTIQGDVIYQVADESQLSGDPAKDLEGYLETQVLPELHIAPSSLSPFAEFLGDAKRAFDSGFQTVSDYASFAGNRIKSGVLGLYESFFNPPASENLSEFPPESFLNQEYK
jgi:hypothetical protein